MERLHSINPDRLVWCCEDRGITPAQLAVDVGVAPLTLDRTLAGEPGITFAQLRRIADYFGRGVLFFLEEGTVSAEQVHTPQFRSLANQKVSLSSKLKLLIERAERQREVFLALQEDLQDDTPRYERPKLPRNDIAGAARAAREWLGLTDVNDFGSYRTALQTKGILVFRSNGYNGKWQIPAESPILGFSLFDIRCPVIVVRKERHESRQSFTLMHELGHVLLHQTSSIDDESDFQSHEGHEREANMFAGLVLAPPALLGRVRDADRPQSVADYDTWLQPYSKAWTVSPEVILRRLLDERRLPKEKYIEYRAWRDRQKPPEEPPGGTRMYRHREPVHIFGDSYVRTVLDSLSERRITLARASSYLDDLKISDLHRLERLYARP